MRFVLLYVHRGLPEDQGVTFGGKSKPNSSLIVVVLPEPFRSRRPKISPR